VLKKATNEGQHRSRDKGLHLRGNSRPPPRTAKSSPGGVLMDTTSMLSSSFQIKGLSFSNRITMAPLYLGYAGADGAVSDLMLDHYREMAGSGVALIVIEHTAAHASGLGSPFMLRADDDRYIPGLSRLAEAIKAQGTLAFLQINHTGRYAFGPDRLAPSPFPTGEVIAKEMSVAQIQEIAQGYAAAALRAKQAGFDGVELHGGMGYLLVQFLSPRTNHRKDAYGGTLENRMRFPLDVVEGVVSAVGDSFPVGYRFLAEEEHLDGLHPDETTVYAKELVRRGLAYLSVVAGTYDSYALPEYAEKRKQDGYMTHWAALIKREVPSMPVITAGRIQTPEFAEQILHKGQADLIALARVLLADPLWPKKALGVIAEPIVTCEPNCSLCQRRTARGKPAYCSQWNREKKEAFAFKVGEHVGEMEDL
jgi:2,4-dienoyl-CoA reductase-like NADH-dependent reductase (Old Yellow Enzyme family)